MFKKFAQNTINPQLSCKTVPCGKQTQNLKSNLRNYFLRSWNLYQKLFQIIKDEQSFYKKPQPLRHPLVFYYGHTATFFINKLIDKGIIKQRINQQFERMLAVGVDQMDWDDLDQTHYQWPTISSIRAYRDKVKNLIVKVIQNSNEKSITWQSDLWVVLMCIDHQRLHLQTSAVILRRLPIYDVRQPEWCKECPFMETDRTKIPINKLKTLSATQIQWNHPIQKAQYYGWDAEFGYKKVKTQQFQASTMLVSNGQFFQFFIEGGYKKNIYWTDEGKKWLSLSKVQKPVFWVIKTDHQLNKEFYYLKTLTREIQMPWDWPVEVNNLEAQAFCRWKSMKQNNNYRLPTEDQYFSLRNLLKTDYQDWVYQSVGNINLQFWASPCPVNMFQIQGFCDIVGNVYQHTVTPLYPFEGFKIHPQYEDFSTPSFDQKHAIIKGGSFISTGNSASKMYRVGFRKHFYQFTGFRYVKSTNQTNINCQGLNQSDQCVQKALRAHYLIKNSYIKQIINFIFALNLNLGQKSLVIGCSVGRLPLQLSKLFKKSYGVDYTARYFQMASRLLEKGYLKYNGTQIDLRQLNMSDNIGQIVKIYQMNPLNMDEKKINEIDFMIIDGLSLRQSDLYDIIKESFKLFNKQRKCYLIIIHKSKIQNQTKLANLISINQIIQFNIKLIKQIELKNQHYDQTIEKYLFLSLN